MMARSRWKVRKAVWDWIACIKVRKNRPVTVADLLATCRQKDRQRITAIPLNSVFPHIPIYNVRLAHRVPCDEKSVNFKEAVKYFFKSTFFTCQVLLYALFPPMQPGLPSIDPNPNVALRDGYTQRHRRAAARAAGRVPSRQRLRPPALGLELQGSLDLGQLAVRGPYAGYLHRIGDDRYEWNLQGLTQYEHLDHLYHLGVRVSFRRNPSVPGLTASQIDSALGTSKPGDAMWPLAKKLSLCAVSTHTTLVRHWNWTHLIAGESIAIATRNALPDDHPLCRLLWPHVFGTHQSNRFGSMVQLGPGGDYGGVFSFTDRGMYRLFDDSYKAYRFSTTDPRMDAAIRGLADAEFDLPTQQNLEALFDVLHRHARQYIGVYYATDREVQRNAPIGQWLEELNRLIPNGVSLSLDTLTRDSLARLIAGILYLVTVYHEIVGAQLWNYQLWTQAQPVRVSKDGRRESVDVYQRLVNMNYLLQVIRTPLINDFTPLALDDAGRQAFRDFQTHLRQLQRQMEREPRAPWKLYPEALEANINA
ncbi:MAG TPA: lipoxygenase family protein [Nitrospiraceae bacterium]|nr:lipoxygenase family protein [Nitrospiraceae bacterium]